MTTITLICVIVLLFQSAALFLRSERHSSEIKSLHSRLHEYEVEQVQRRKLVQSLGRDPEELLRRAQELRQMVQENPT